MSAPSDPAAIAKKPRRRWWRFFLQFSLRTLLVVTTLAAVGCWWFLQPETREEEIAGKHLKLRRQVKLLPIEGQPAGGTGNADLFAGEDFALMNVGRWQLQDEHGDRLVSGRYHEGLPHGKWTVYHTSGRKAAEGSVLRGARNGKWKTWDAEGRLLSEVTYRAAEPKVDFSKSIGAQDLATIPWEAQRHGPARTWYLSGQLKFAGNFADDRQGGKWTYYDEQGRMTGQGQYWRDQKEWKWHESPLAGGGSELREFEYVAGMPRADHEKLLERLQDELTSGSMERQVAAAERLERLGPSGVPLLLAALDQQGDNVRAIAARALERIAAQDAAAPRGKFPAAEILAKVEPLVDATDERLARQAMLIVYRFQPQRREALLTPLLAAAGESPDAEIQHRILKTLLEFDSSSRQRVFNQLAVQGERQYRESSATWGASGPYQTPFSPLNLACDMQDELPTLLPAAFQSSDAAAQCFVLRILDQLARQRPAKAAANQQRRHPVPAQYEKLVAQARSDPDPQVREAAENIGTVQAPLMPAGISGGFF